MESIVKGLLALESLNIYHYDLRPSTIVISKDDKTFKLTD